MNNFNNLISDVINARFKRANELSERIKDIEYAFNKEKIYKEFSFTVNASLILKWKKVIDDPIKFRLTLSGTEIEERPLIEQKLDIRENITIENLNNFLIAFKDFLKK